MADDAQPEETGAAVGNGSEENVVERRSRDSAPFPLMGEGPLAVSVPNGGEGCLPALVAAHADILYRYAYRLTGSTADAEDLTQQTFLIAHQKLGQVRDAECVRGWLLTVLRRVYFKAERRSRPERLLQVALDIDNIPQDVVDHWEIDRELLQVAINELPDAYKLVVLSYYFEDLSYREIAERFQLPVGTVMSRLSRAKDHLRTRLLEVECAVGARRS